MWRHPRSQGSLSCRRLLVSAALEVTMEEIYLEDEIAALEPKKVIVSVFILSGYDRSAYKWVLDTWKQIDEDTGANWVLLVPVNRRGSFPREIDVSLSDRIREMYGIDRQQTPCLVFDNFVEDEH